MVEAIVSTSCAAEPMSSHGLTPPQLGLLSVGDFSDCCSHGLQKLVDLTVLFLALRGQGVIWQGSCLEGFMRCGRSRCPLTIQWYPPVARETLFLNDQEESNAKPGEVRYCCLGDVSPISINSDHLVA